MRVIEQFFLSCLYPAVKGQIARALCEHFF